MNKKTRDKLARVIWDELWADLGDRGGFRQTWDGCDRDIQREITNTMRGIISSKLGGIPDPGVTEEELDALTVAPTFIDDHEPDTDQDRADRKRISRLVAIVSRKLKGETDGE